MMQDVATLLRNSTRTCSSESTCLESCDDVTKPRHASEVDEFMLNTSQCAKTPRRRVSRETSLHSNAQASNTVPSNDEREREALLSDEEVDSNGELVFSAITPVRRRKIKAAAIFSESEWSQTEEIDQKSTKNLANSGSPVSLGHRDRAERIRDARKGSNPWDTLNSLLIISKVFSKI